MADMNNFEKIKVATVDEIAKWLTELHKEVQKQAYEAVADKIKEYIIKPEENQFEEWKKITFNFYKNWLESEAE